MKNIYDGLGSSIDKSAVKELQDSLKAINIRLELRRNFLFSELPPEIKEQIGDLHQSISKSKPSAIGACDEFSKNALAIIPKAQRNQTHLIMK